ncbi:MAG: excinuclease ABC subunit UvrB [Patescibacteria group bacterium]
MIFRLCSKFKPAGDQPEAIEKLTAGTKKGYPFQTLLGVTGSGKTFTMAEIIEKTQRPTLVISHNKTLTAQLASEFAQFFPQNAVHYFVSYYDYYQPEAYIPQTDTYIAKDAKINDEIDRLRHAATSSLLSRRDVIICASVSCIYNLGSPLDYQKVRIILKKGERRERDFVLKQLVAIKYTRNDVDFHRGTFRARGDVLEIFPVYAISEIIRVEFFDGQIEKITKLNYLTGEKIKTLSEIEIYPATHYVAPDEKMKMALLQIKEDLNLQVKELIRQRKNLEAKRLRQRTNYDLEMMKEISFCHGIENYSRYFDGRAPGQPPFTLLDYFPKDFLLFIDESHQTVPQLGGMYEGDKSRKDILVDFGFRLPSCRDNRPLKFLEFEKKIGQCIFVSATPREYERKKSKQIIEQLIRPTGLLDPKVEIKPTSGQIDDLILKIKARVVKKQRVLVTTLTKRLAEELTDYLLKQDVKCHYLHSEIKTFERLEILRDLRQGIYDVIVGINLLREGLDLPEVSLVAILDADKESYLRDSISLIQTIGRAARHTDGHIVMYADKISKSMKYAIAETQRRRKIQEKYNKKHNIIPRSIKKEIYETRLAGIKEKEILPKIDFEKLLKNKKSVKEYLHDLQNQMELFAQNLEFEKAARVRDEIKTIKMWLNKKNLTSK